MKKERGVRGVSVSCRRAAFLYLPYDTAKPCLTAQWEAKPNHHSELLQKISDLSPVKYSMQVLVFYCLHLTRKNSSVAGKNNLDGCRQRRGAHVGLFCIF